MIAPLGEFWGRMADIQAKVANVPDKWLLKFAASEAHRRDIRKMGTATNATLLYRGRAVLEAVEAGETFSDEKQEGGQA